MIAQLTILGEGGVLEVRPSGLCGPTRRAEPRPRRGHLERVGTWANGLADDVKVALTPYRRRPDRPHVCQMPANATAQVPPSCAFALLHVRLRHRRKVPPGVAFMACALCGSSGVHAAARASVNMGRIAGVECEGQAPRSQIVALCARLEALGVHAIAKDSGISLLSSTAPTDRHPPGYYVTPESWGGCVPGTESLSEFAEAWLNSENAHQLKVQLGRDLIVADERHTFLIVAFTDLMHMWSDERC